MSSNGHSRDYTCDTVFSIIAIEQPGLSISRKWRLSLQSKLEGIRGWPIAPGRQLLSYSYQVRNLSTMTAATLKTIHGRLSTSLELSHYATIRSSIGLSPSYLHGVIASYGLPPSLLDVRVIDQKQQQQGNWK